MLTILSSDHTFKHFYWFQTFRRLLLNKCQDEFENRSRATEGKVYLKWPRNVVMNKLSFY